MAGWLTEKSHKVGSLTANDKDERLVQAALAQGVEEVRVIRTVENYIHIGNTAVHGAKRALRLKHRVLRPDWLVSRAIEPQKDAIYVWG